MFFVLLFMSFFSGGREEKGVTIFKKRQRSSGKSSEANIFLREQQGKANLDKANLSLSYKVEGFQKGIKFIAWLLLYRRVNHKYNETTSHNARKSVID